MCSSCLWIINMIHPKSWCVKLISWTVLSLVLFAGVLYGQIGVHFAQVYVEPPLNTELVIAVVVPEVVHPKVIGITPETKAGQSGLGVMQHEGADVVIGSGFVQDYSPPVPVGLLIVDGNIVSPLNLRGGLKFILAVRNNNIQIVSRETFDYEGVTGAIQVGPCLVKDGRVSIHSDEPDKIKLATRSFVGILSDGNIIVGVTLSPVSLLHLAKHLVSEYQCIDAVNLAGGGSEVFAIRQDEEIKSFGNRYMRQASTIAFLPR